MRTRPGPVAAAPAILAGAVLALGLGLAGCAAGDEEPEPAESPPPEVAAARERAHAAAAELGQRLTEALSDQLAGGTHAAAIDVCSRIAPAAAAEMSRAGLEIRRTSLRYRNPGNAPDAWERAGLERLAEALAAGQPPRELHEIDEERGELRLLRPILVAPGCLPCHGVAHKLDPAVGRELARRYPDDRATGFATGDLRGAFSVRVRLEPTGSP